MKTGKVKRVEVTVEVDVAKIVFYVLSFIGALLHHFL